MPEADLIFGCREEDVEWFETHTFTAEEIRYVFSVPPEAIGQLSKATDADPS